MKQYNHISQQERELIFLYHNQSKSNRDIGKLLGRDQRTIGRELVRNSSRTNNRYLPSSAQEMAVKRRQEAKIGKLDDPALRSFVVNKLGRYWSPEQIAGRLKLKAPSAYVSAETIYTFIYQKKNKKLRLFEFLRRRHPKRQLFNGRKVKRKRQIPYRVFIDQRPQTANLRREIGHWETDNMEGKRKTGGYVSALCDRKSLIVKLDKLKSKKPEEKHQSLIRQFRREEYPFVKTITMDNGTENFHHYKVANDLFCKTYFCNPYHAWEKGTVENTIGLVRQYIPKGTDLTTISTADLIQIADELNNRPRKKLKFQTPLEVFNSETNWGTSF